MQQLKRSTRMGVLPCFALWFVSSCATFDAIWPRCAEPDFAVASFHQASRHSYEAALVAHVGCDPEFRSQALLQIIHAFSIDWVSREYSRWSPTIGPIILESVRGRRHFVDAELGYPAVLPPGARQRTGLIESFGVDVRWTPDRLILRTKRSDGRAGYESSEVYCREPYGIQYLQQNRIGPGEAAKTDCSLDGLSRKPAGRGNTGFYRLKLNGRANYSFDLRVDSHDQRIVIEDCPACWLG